jgi:uncharacterized protein (UPF0332 family)
MLMPYDELVKQGRIKAYKATREEIGRLLSIANRDLKAAQRNLDDDPDWAYSMAYNALLQASRAVMLTEGYRPRGPDQHATVVAFIRENFQEINPTLTDFFDQMRRKRHRLIYETVGLVSHSETQQVIEQTKGYLEILEKMIEHQPDLGL